MLKMHKKMMSLISDVISGYIIENNGTQPGQSSMNFSGTYNTDYNDAPIDDEATKRIQE